MLDALGNASDGQILIAIVAAAAISCLVGWLLEGGFGPLRDRWQALNGASASVRAARGPQDDAPDFGDEFVRALALAVNSYVEGISDEQAIIDTIVTQLGWSPTRARWFFAVNRDQVEQAARQMRLQARDERRASGR